MLHNGTELAEAENERRAQAGDHQSHIVCENAADAHTAAEDADELKDHGKSLHRIYLRIICFIYYIKNAEKCPFVFRVFFTKINLRAIIFLYEIMLSEA